MRFRLFIICVIVLFAFSIAGAANRVMIPLDTVHTYVDSFDLPIAFENDVPIEGISNGFIMTTSGNLTAEFIDFPYRVPGTRADSIATICYYDIIPGQIYIGTFMGPYWGPLLPGPLVTMYCFPIGISGEVGEICIDTCFHPPAGGWHWIKFGGDAVYPSFNDDNGPHCIVYTEQIMCGDANDDGLINVSDPVYLLNYIFLGGPPPSPYDNGDANCDGTVNISDVVWIKNYIFMSGRAPCDTDGDGVPDC